jgi:hypothetical protein
MAWSRSIACVVDMIFTVVTAAVEAIGADDDEDEIGKRGK